MNEKTTITRRVLLGTLIGGLAIGPFITYNLRKNQKDLPFQEIDPYGRIELPLERVDSDLSKNELQMCLDVIQQERSMWLRYRGTEGNIFAETNYHNPSTKEKNTTVTGFLAWKFDYSNSSKGKFYELSPVDYRLSFLKSKNGTPIWSLTLQDRSGAKPKIEGDNITGMEYSTVFQLLVATTTTLPSFSNGVIEDILRLYKINKNPDAPNDPKSFIIESNGDLTSDKLIPPTLRFLNGHLVQYIPKRRPNSIFPVLAFQNIVEKNGIAFPQTISMRYNMVKKMPPQNMDYTFSLSFQDMDVISVDA